MVEHFLGTFKRGVRPAQFFLALLQVFRAKGRAVALFAAFQRRTVPDTGMANDDGRFVLFRFRFFNRLWAELYF